VVPDSGRDDTRWSAHVLRIGRVYGPTTLENDPQVRANARTVECVLAFDEPSSDEGRSDEGRSDQTRNLRIGQRVMVRFGAAPTPPRTGPKG
jgi:hypothetical protein